MGNLHRIRVVLVEKSKTGNGLLKRLIKRPARLANGVVITFNLI